MVDIAVRSGMAKTTLYNHFRTKDEVIAALVAVEIDEILRDALTVHDDPAKSLARAAWRLSTHSVLRGAVRVDSSVTATILASYPDADVWSEVGACVGQWLTAVGLADQPAARELLVRWLTSAALMPSALSSAALPRSMGSDLEPTTAESAASLLHAQAVVIVASLPADT
jgi:AcrR family transcriptional regulator